MDYGIHLSVTLPAIGHWDLCPSSTLHCKAVIMLSMLLYVSLRIWPLSHYPNDATVIYYEICIANN